MDKSMTELRSVTCHMGPHSVTCHSTQVTQDDPRLDLPANNIDMQLRYIPDVVVFAVRLIVAYKARARLIKRLLTMTATQTSHVPLEVR